MDFLNTNNIPPNTTQPGPINGPTLTTTAPASVVPNPLVQNLGDAHLLAASNQLTLQQIIAQQLKTLQGANTKIPPKELDELSRAIDIKLDKMA